MEIVEKISASGMRIWYALPESELSAPLMVMLHERYGPVEHSFNVIKRMASYGYVACFADLFHRYQGEEDRLNVLRLSTTLPIFKQSLTLTKQLTS